MHHRFLPVRAAFLFLSASLVAACGGSSNSPSADPPAGSTPAAPAAGAPALTVTVRSPATALPHGLRVPLAFSTDPAQASTTCSAVDPVALDVAPDCSAITGWRLGDQQVRVTAPGGAQGLGTIRIIPQRRWAGLSADAVSAPTLLVATPAGQALAWGSNWVGLLGRGLADKRTEQPLPAPVLTANGQPLTGIVQTQLAGSVALALTDEGRVWAWGESRYTASGERSGNRTAAVPVLAAPGRPLERVVQLAAADGAVAVVLEDGSMLGWGAYSGSGSADLVDYPAPVVDASGAPLTGIRTVVGGWSAIAALGADGRVRVWGSGMGPDGTTQTSARTIRTANGAELESIVSLAAGSNFLLALDAAGEVHAAGSNDSGQLGQGGITAVPGWVAVPVRNAAGTAPLGEIAMVAAGPRVGLALDRQGRVWSWGSVNTPVIGCGVYRCNTGGNYRALPGPVIGENGTGQLSQVISIKASDGHGLALRADGTVLAWGRAGAALGQGRIDSPEAWVPSAVHDEHGASPLLLDPQAYPNLTEGYP